MESEEEIPEGMVSSKVDTVKGLPGPRALGLDK